ncbi:dipeptidase [Ameyamaea chiangmaiensis]|uniref:Dipeptidase n=2 Tax=Ameyamaea chiangmaiensis TaxID=442969 RepID=A0A850PB97_9PROT|nr:dipeptidase [Ameyamaea chiangmaiensis]NVN39202.1 dipeptidase [Ameyamaea chiangmaiensis]
MSPSPGTQPGTLTGTLERVDASIDDALSRLFALLRIPSVSAQPEHAADCAAAARYLRDELLACGFDASIRDTPGHPMVVAHDLGATTGPHVLFYGHYDVQPVDPLALWKTAPFEPTLITTESGRVEITARGASDDKGQVMTFIEACRALRAQTGALPVRVSIILEGEEESGSDNLRPFLEQHREELRADIALICDTGMIAPDQPAITGSLRGLVGEEVTIEAARRDLHSGLYGNAARNPIECLCTILGTVRDADGRVTLPGFYDGIAVPPDGQRAAWRAIDPDDNGLLGPVGLAVPAGEAGFTALEQTWCRPSFEINGISGGYEGEGFKTVLPARATAKVSFRLVPGQDPERIRAAFRAHVNAALPSDCRARFTPHGGSKGIALPPDGPFMDAALGALSAEWAPNRAVVIGGGGSIPVVSDLREVLGMDTLLIGFALDDDRIHAPNEKYDLASFHKGIRAWVRVLDALAS